MSRSSRGEWRPALCAPLIAVGVLMVVYVTIFGTLSLRRHQNLHTNALDLGYTDQAVWNTLHGRPFQFSTYLDAAFRLGIPIQDFRQPGMLLSYHVEPILAAIAPLYLLHDGPETLLWLQTLGIALGAIPVYLLARYRLGQREPNLTSPGTSPASGFRFHVSHWIPLVFVLIYLLSPSLEAANLSDFHSVALSPALLLAAFYFLETDRPWAFGAFAFLAAMCKEEVGLLAAMMGLWAAFVRRRWLLGLGVFLGGVGWSLLSLLVIIPHFNGLESSAFVVRYRQFGDSPAGIVGNLVRQPGRIVDWLRRPEVIRYLRDLWLSSGGLSILYPLSLVMALPVLAINTFSVYDWMHSGGGHYSAAIAPFLVISAIYGVDWLARGIGRWGNGRLGMGGARVYQVVVLSLTTLGLVVALAHHHQNGVSPLSRRFALEPITEHARRAESFFERVNNLPPEVAISASSGLFPHVGHRERVYLFPTVSDAQYILIDVLGPPTPAGTGEQRQIVRDLLDYAEFGVAESDHGFLLLERGADEYRLSPTFDQAFLADGATPQVSTGADFGGLLRLEGFDRTTRPVVRPESVVQIATYWRVLAPLEDELRLVFYFWDEGGQLVRVQPEEVTMHWYPTWLWEPGEVVKVSLPALPVGDLPHVGVAVLHPHTGDLEIEGRVVPITSAGEHDLVLQDQDTILELVNR